MALTLQPRYIALGVVCILFALCIALVNTLDSSRWEEFRNERVHVRPTNQATIIKGKTYEDVAWGIGYAQAKDRLVQLEFQRRLGSGKLSEVLGLKTLELDKMMRTMGFRRIAEHYVKHEVSKIFPDDNMREVQAFLDGINFAAERQTHEPEFLLLGIKFEPYTLVDLCVFTFWMHYILSGGVGMKLVRDLLPTLMDKDLAHLFTYNPFNGDRATPAGSVTLDKESIEKLLAGLDRTLLNEGLHASNAWVVSGRYTKHGAPILSNDPHLGAKIPGPWYPLSLEWDGGKFDGFTIVGFPYPFVGRSDKLAFGVTVAMVEQHDLYYERIENGRYQVDNVTNEWRDVEEIEERIVVAKTEDVTHKVRMTRHGVILTDMDFATKRPEVLDSLGSHMSLMSGFNASMDMSSRWLDFYKDPLDPTRMSDSSIVFFSRFFRASSFDEVRGNLGNLQIALNYVYADDAGNIGYFTMGSNPIRRSGHRPWIPAPGWMGERFEWEGYVAPKDLPYSYNPQGLKSLMIEINAPF